MEAPDQPTRQRGAVPPPRCKAILMCEKTITEARTGNTSLINIFQSFAVSAFPGRTVPAIVYLVLSDGIGEYQVMVEIHDLAKDRVLSRSPDMPIKFKDKLSRVTMTIGIPPVPLPHPGLYDLVVRANGQEIDRIQFQAIACRPPKAPPEE